MDTLNNYACPQSESIFTHGSWPWKQFCERYQVEKRSVKFLRPANGKAGCLLFNVAGDSQTKIMPVSSEIQKAADIIRPMVGALEDKNDSSKVIFILYNAPDMNGRSESIPQLQQE